MKNSAGGQKQIKNYVYTPVMVQSSTDMNDELD